MGGLPQECYRVDVVLRDGSHCVSLDDVRLGAAERKSDLRLVIPAPVYLQGRVAGAGDAADLGIQVGNAPDGLP